MLLYIWPVLSAFEWIPHSNFLGMSIVRQIARGIAPTSKICEREGSEHATWEGDVLDVLDVYPCEEYSVDGVGPLRREGSATLLWISEWLRSITIRCTRPGCANRSSTCFLITVTTILNGTTYRNVDLCSMTFPQKWRSSRSDVCADRSNS